MKRYEPMKSKLCFTCSAWLLAVYLVAVSLVLWYRESASLAIIVTAALTGFLSPSRGVGTGLGGAIGIGAWLVAFQWVSFALDGPVVSISATLGAFVVGVAAWCIKLLCSELLHGAPPKLSPQKPADRRERFVTALQKINDRHRRALRNLATKERRTESQSEILSSDTCPSLLR
jgi:hypothetical protein